MNTTFRIVAAAAVTASSLALAACSGSSDSSDSAIGGGSAECTEQVMETNAEGSAKAAGLELIDTKSYECDDGWAIVFAITKSGDIEQTTAFVYEAEGPVWAQKQLDSLCNGNPDGAPQKIIDQACALR